MAKLNEVLPLLKPSTFSMTNAKPVKIHAIQLNGTKISLKKSINIAFPWYFTQYYRVVSWTVSHNTTC